MTGKLRFRLSPLAIFTYVVVIFLFAPLLAVLAASLTKTNYPIFPPQGITFHWYKYALDYRPFVSSFTISILLASFTAVVSTGMGTLAALAIVRYRFPGRDLITTFVMSPLILPTVLIGIGLLQFYSSLGIKASLYTLLIGHTIITSPYVLRMVTASLAGFDRNLELAARNLGATALQTFLRVTFPLISAGVLAGAAFAFIVSFDDVTMSVFLSSPKVTTLPVRIFAQEERGMTTYLLAAGSWMIFFAGIVMIILDRTIGVGRVFGIGPGAREQR